MRKIQEVAGLGSADTEALLEALQKEDFDEADYDKLMQKMYGEEYYQVRSSCPFAPLFGPVLRPCGAHVPARVLG